MKNKKGISLIVLVITIIVMIILAAAIILSLNNAGIIGNANKAVDESNLANAKTVAEIEYAQGYAEGLRGDELKERVIGKLEEIEFDMTKYGVTVKDTGVTIRKLVKCTVKYFIDDRKIVITFEEGMTWEDYINSSYTKSFKPNDKTTWNIGVHNGLVPVSITEWISGGAAFGCGYIFSDENATIKVISNSAMEEGRTYFMSDFD